MPARLRRDAWGYLLENRTYISSNGKFKFTGKERDKESSYDYFGARYYDSRIGRWGQTEPLLFKNTGYGSYCYAKNNPIARIDPDGLDDYYYMKDKTIINPTPFETRLFVEHPLGNIAGKDNEQIIGYNFFQANSFETISLYEWDKIDLGFKEGKFVEAFQDAIPSITERMYIPPELYIFKESIGGKMDQKSRVLNIKKTLFLFDNILYNRNEAANIVWGAVNAYLGIGSAEIAQMFADVASRYVNDRPDEKWDQVAIKHGFHYYDDVLEHLTK